MTPRGKESRGRILKTAFDLFHRNGLNATCIDDILTASNTGKSQFYYYFKNKEDLVHAILQEMYRVMKAGEGGPVKTKLDTWADLQKWFEHFVEFQKRNGGEKS